MAICDVCGGDKKCKKRKAKTYDVPFYCEKCGNIKFKYTPINGCVFISPIYKYVKKVTSSIIEIPDSIVKQHKSDYGIIIAISDSYYNKKRKFIANDSLEIGDMICYDKTVPWGDRYKGTDGKFYPVVLCNLVDLLAKCDNE